MLEELKYINHKNEELDMGKNGIYVNYNDLHDYAWEYTLTNDKISLFSRGVVTKTIPLVIICESEEEGIRLKNNLMEIAERDVLEMSPGKIVIGDYYLECYITASKKSDYLIHKKHMQVTLTVTTDSSVWIRETTTVFKPMQSMETSNDDALVYLDYPVDYLYDYTSELGNDYLNNDHFVASDFRMIIYGPCVNPTVYIAGHKYMVYTDIAEGEYLTINSMTKKIYITENDGTVVNCFSLRDRESYIFEPIPAEINEVAWSGEFGFDIALFEERSEPKWT